MYLLAEMSGSTACGWIIWIVIFALGSRKICAFLRGNNTARDAAKQGGMAIVRKLFKK